MDPNAQEPPPPWARPFSRLSISAWLPLPSKTPPPLQNARSPPVPNGPLPSGPKPPLPSPPLPEARVYQPQLQPTQESESWRPPVTSPPTRALGPRRRAWSLRRDCSLDEPASLPCLCAERRHLLFSCFLPFHRLIKRHGHQRGERRLARPGIRLNRHRAVCARVRTCALC